MQKSGRPYFRYDDPSVQGAVYDTTGLGSWWQSYFDDETGQADERLIGRDKPRNAE